MKICEAFYGDADPKCGQHYAWLFWCPGCEEPHQYDPRWAFNGNREKPTFTPSLLVNGDPQRKNPTAPRCHLYLTDGKLQFLADCEHKLAGQTVDLPDWPYGEDG